MNIDLIKEEIAQIREERNAITFEPVAIPDNYETGDLINLMHQAEAAYFYYKKIQTALTPCDLLSDSLNDNDLLTEEDSHRDYDDCTIDLVNGTLHHVTCQVAKFKDLCDRLEVDIEEALQIERDDAKYGTYQQQVANTYYGSR